MSRSAWVRAVVAGTSLVVLGAVLGVTADRMLHANRSAAPSAAALHEAALERFRAELALDDGQVRAIDSMLRHHQETVGTTWSALRHHLSAAVDTVHRDIESVLTAEQRDAFRAWLTERSDAAELRGHAPH
jgi:uncharacterized protein (DUF305 family)